MMSDDSKLTLRQSIEAFILGLTPKEYKIANKLWKSFSDLKGSRIRGLLTYRKTKLKYKDWKIGD
jgi:hypothetical protein